MGLDDSVGHQLGDQYDINEDGISHHASEHFKLPEAEEYGNCANDTNDDLSSDICSNGVQTILILLDNLHTKFKCGTIITKIKPKNFPVLTVYLL